MRAKLETCKNITFAETTVTIRSALNADSRDALDRLVEELCRDYIARSGDRANKNDLTALFRIGYGLYVVTSNDGKRDTRSYSQHRFAGVRQSESYRSQYQ